MPPPGKTEIDQISDPHRKTDQQTPGVGIEPQGDLNDHPNSATPIQPAGGSLFGLLPRKQGWTHNKNLGYRATQGRLAQMYDQDGDMDMIGGGKNNTNNEKLEKEATAEMTEWAVVGHHRDTALALKVAFDDLSGNTHKEKLGDLMDILMDNKIRLPAKPTKMRIDGRHFYRVALATQEEMEHLLEGVTDSTLDQQSDDEGEQQSEGGDDASESLEEDEEEETPIHAGESRRLFERIDMVAEKKHDMARSIELYGLPARTDMALLRMAANQVGEVDKVSLKGCTRGIKMIATIWYMDTSSVETLKTHQVQHITVGNNLVRVRRAGEDMLRWELQHACKLHGLPRGTTPAAVMAALRTLEVNADFVEVPKFYVNNGNQVRHRQEAFVYFKTAEDMSEAMKTAIKMGDSLLVWLDTKEKRCYSCNLALHIGSKCPVLERQIENREHKKKVMDFHAKQRTALRTGASFADLVRGKGPERGNREGGQDKGKQRANEAAETTPTSTPVTQETQATQASKAVDHSKMIAELTAKQRILEATMADMQKSMADMHRTVTQLMENQNSMMANMTVMINEVRGMMAGMGGNAHSHQDAYLDTCSQQSDTPLVDKRKLKKMKTEGEGKYNPAPLRNIPSPNASRAGIEAVIMAQKAGGGSQTPAGGGPASNTRANIQHIS